MDASRGYPSCELEVRGHRLRVYFNRMLIFPLGVTPLQDLRYEGAQLLVYLICCGKLGTQFRVTTDREGRGYMRGLLLGTFLLLLAVAAPAWAAMEYECADGRGGWLWQAQPCAPGQARPGSRGSAPGPVVKGGYIACLSRWWLDEMTEAMMR